MVLAVLFASGLATGQAKPPGDDVIGTIEIPRLGVSSVVREGDDERTLRRGVGHVRGTPPPETLGNVGFAGHRTSFFKPLRRIRPGDVIRLRTPTVIYTYEVLSSEIVKPEDTGVFDRKETPALTLVTCYPFEYKGHAPRRFVVHAERVAVTTAPDAWARRGPNLTR